MVTTPGTESIEAADEATQSERLDATESEQLSRIKRYDQRVEEWLTSLKEEAGLRSPEVLSALAAKAQDVADYLNRTAEKAKARGEAPGVAISADDTSTTDESGAVSPVENKETT
jgi:hypothetical protein